MVIKQQNNSKAPEMDEAWWTALLADEDKYKNTRIKDSTTARRIFRAGKP